MSSIWTLVPHSGIEDGEMKIRLGMSRAEIREMLREAFDPPKSNYAEEDDFHNADGAFLRLRYDGEKLQEIEFIEGRLVYDGQPLSEGATWPDVEKFLTAKGITIRDTQWLGDGFDCLELAINIATHEQVGGDEEDDGIEWVILSTMFVP